MIAAFRFFSTAITGELSFSKKMVIMYYNE